ncbi:MAG: hypothetical protein Sapg2KO_33000 [Saprospiraceae bacterium]
MRKGKVQYYLTDKGYGFIRDLENREEFHFSKKNILNKVVEKDLVVFEINENKQGLHAIKVRRITAGRGEK